MALWEVIASLIIIQTWELVEGFEMEKVEKQRFVAGSQSKERIVAEVYGDNKIVAGSQSDRRSVEGIQSDKRTVAGLKSDRDAANLLREVMAVVEGMSRMDNTSKGYEGAVLVCNNSEYNKEGAVGYVMAGVPPSPWSPHNWADQWL